jgi:hypothetical protein
MTANYGCYILGLLAGSNITAVFYWPKSSYFLSLVKREGDLRTKVLKWEERFNISRFKAGIKSLAAKAALPPIKLVSEGCNRGTLGGRLFTKGRKQQRRLSWIYS